MLGIGNEAAGFMYIKLKRKSSIVNSMELILEAPSGIEPEMAILQTAALPLGYGAVWPRKRRKRSR